MTVAPVSIVVNADDLGVNTRVNDAISAALSENVITSATLMANGAAIADAVRIAKAFPQATFGVHLVLSELPPLTADPALRPLLDEHGAFVRHPFAAARWSPSLIAAVAREWIAQVRRVQQLGVRVSHLDSHHHVHTSPRTFLALKRVQMATAIRRVRGTWTIYEKARMPTPGLRRQKGLWMTALRHVYRTRTADAFGDFVMFVRASGERAFRPTPRLGTIELMVHPGVDSRECREETALLRTRWLSELPFAAHLASYDTI